jgi:histidinol-phosphate aminotransferase
MISEAEVENMVRPVLHTVQPYEPVDPPSVLSQKVNMAEKDIVKIDANENPYGPSVKARKALAEYPYINLYPDPYQRSLRRSLEKYTGFSSQNIVAGSGSDELIELILRLFLEPGDKVINCPPTFSMYPFCTQICAGTTVNIPRIEDFSLDMAAIKKAIDKSTKVIFIASPNNPSGNLIQRDEVLQLLDAKMIVVIDEAYFEFSRVTCADMVHKYPNLLILRTFSKWAGLAGLRVGYGIFPTNIVNHILRIKQPYNVNAAAQVAAMESLNDQPYLQSTVDKIIAERSRLISLLKSFSWLQVFDSSANFVLCKVLNREAKKVHLGLQRKGIFIRYYNSPQLENYIRISIGKVEQTDRLIAELREVN